MDYNEEVEAPCRNCTGLAKQVRALKLAVEQERKWRATAEAKQNKAETRSREWANRHAKALTEIERLSSEVDRWRHTNANLRRMGYAAPISHGGDVLTLQHHDNRELWVLRQEMENLERENADLRAQLSVRA